MFPKLLAIILALALTAASLLVERQRRLELSHRASAIHRRLNEQEARCWAIQARIAECCGLDRVRAAMQLVSDSWRPIGARPEPTVELACAGPHDAPGLQAQVR